jgi:hypothetical protein
MKIGLAIVALLLLGAVSLAQEKPPWAAKSYHVLVDGNRLYTDCQSAEKNVRMTEKDTTEVRADAGDDLFIAGLCWGYVAAVVDSIPVGEGFELDAKVKGSQYVDVVQAYLRDHPESRHLPAHYLVRSAITQAFPAKSKR